MTFINGCRDFHTVAGKVYASAAVSRYKTVVFQLLKCYADTGLGKSQMMGNVDCPDASFLFSEDQDCFEVVFCRLKYFHIATPVLSDSCFQCQLHHIGKRILSFFGCSFFSGNKVVAYGHYRHGVHSVVSCVHVKSGSLHFYCHDAH